MDEIRISVRNLVEFILRTGDIDNRTGQMAAGEAMQLGARLHRKIQNSMGSGYRAEVSMKDTWECGAYRILVEGRADGIFQDVTDEEEPERISWIDEIKGVYRNLNRVEEPVPVHEGQARCYAYMYARQHDLKRIGVQMTYCNLKTEDVRRFRQVYTAEELGDWYRDLLNAYAAWCDFEREWHAVRQASIPGTAFPFPYREGQKDLAAAVYRTIARKKKLFIQAPTGVGKTLSTVFPAVKAVGEGLGDKIFYLTAKNITRTVAWDAFQLLKAEGLQYKVLMLTAKEKLCPLGEPDCNPAACPCAKGHYDRVNDAVFELLTTQSAFSRETLLAQAEKRCVCPFEMSLDLSEWVDAVICDYNYVFDPRARLKRFFGEGEKGEYIFLIDEAHNLVERGREMFSAALYKEDFLALKREVQPYSRSLTRALEACNRKMLAWKRECEEYRICPSLETFPVMLTNLSEAMEAYMEEGTDTEIRRKVTELFFEVSAFREIYDGLDENYRIYTRLDEEGRFLVRLYCINTAKNLLACMEKGRSSIFFSATLLPIRYYMGLLCGQMDSYAVCARSPFPRGNRLVLVGTDVSSRYRRRGPREYARIAAYIRQVSACRRGNYMVFCPSYRMLEEISAAFLEDVPAGAEVLCQSSGMTEPEREAFLARFTEERGEASAAHTLIGFTVMGGIFGEGIDLKGESLIGAVVVGTGLPQVCCEREILKGFYDERGEDGFSRSYTIPGMNKVLQSAGRVIRTAEDRGVVLLLDDRFTREEYGRMFPLEWEGYGYCTLSTVGEQVGRFWEKTEQI